MMRRFVAAVVLLVLVAPLCGIARADLRNSASTPFAVPTDLRAAFALRTFGRLPGEYERLSGDTFERTAIRGLSFRGTSERMAVPVLRVSGLPRPGLALPPIPTISLAFNRVFNLNDALTRYSDHAGVVPSLQPARFAPSSPAPDADATTGLKLALAMPSLQTSSNTVASNDAAFDGTPPAFASRLQDSMTAVSTPLRVGSFAMTGELERAQFDALRAHEDRLVTGTTFSPRIGTERIDLSVGSDYERFTNGQSSFPYVATTASANFGGSPVAALPGGGAAALSQNFNDITARGVNAGVAVPLAHNLTAGIGYGAQRFTGTFGSGFQPALDTSQYLYLGNVTFAIPRTSSAITLSAQQARVQDNLNPANPAYSQTRADLNFTVKF
jgi:hypothetical protein